jgi:DNA repair exonuclease SbcCD ATPase subunit
VTEIIQVRACEAADVTLHALTTDGQRRLAALLGVLQERHDALVDSTRYPLDNLTEAKRKATDAYTSLQRIRAEVYDTEVEQCPFDGLVEVHLREAGAGYMHEQWQCPLCGTEHEDSYHRSELD